MNCIFISSTNFKIITIFTTCRFSVLSLWSLRYSFRINGNGHICLRTVHTLSTCNRSIFKVVLTPYRRQRHGKHP